MSGKFPNLSWWLWSGKKKDGKLQNKSYLNSLAKSNERELDLLNYDVGGGKIGSSSRRISRKRRSRELVNIDKEHDSVVVPSDGGGYSSDSESDSSDWSIGWSEPHAPGFLSEDEIDGGFGVLVRCYGRTSEEKPESNKNSLGSISRVPHVYVTGNWIFMILSQITKSTSSVGFPLFKVAATDIAVMLLSLLSLTPMFVQCFVNLI